MGAMIFVAHRDKYTHRQFPTETHPRLRWCDCGKISCFHAQTISQCQLTLIDKIYAKIHDNV